MEVLEDELKVLPILLNHQIRPVDDDHVDTAQKMCFVAVVPVQNHSKSERRAHEHVGFVKFLVQFQHFFRESDADSEGVVVVATEKFLRIILNSE